MKTQITFTKYLLLLVILLFGGLLSGCGLWESGKLRENPTPSYENIDANASRTEDGLEIYKASAGDMQ